MRVGRSLQRETTQEERSLAGKRESGKTPRLPPLETHTLTCAVPLFRVQSKATVAPALEAADGVSALAVGTEARYHLALVDIFRKRKKKHARKRSL